MSIVNTADIRDAEQTRVVPHLPVAGALSASSVAIITRQLLAAAQQLAHATRLEILRVPRTFVESTAAAPPPQLVRPLVGVGHENSDHVGIAWMVNHGEPGRNSGTLTSDRWKKSRPTAPEGHYHVYGSRGRSGLRPRLQSPANGWSRATQQRVATGSPDGRR